MQHLRRSFLPLPDPPSKYLLARLVLLQEIRNLLVAPALWVMFIIVSLLVGYSFFQAVDLFSQASRTALSYPEMASGMNPLEGIFMPTFGAYYLSQTLLLPFVVAGNVDNFKNGEITVRFKGVAGRIDQGAGILFDLKPNGDYYAIRANPLEHNLVLWRYKHGKRSSVSWVRNVKTPSHKWHDLKLTVDGTLIKGYVNGKQYLAHRLPDAVSGKVGLWTKADSVVYFDDYQVTAR